MTSVDQDIKSVLNQGLQELQRGNNVDALQAFEQVLNLDADHCEALNFAGAAAWQSGDLDKALIYLDRAMQKHPNHPRAYLNLGVILEHHDRLDEAVNAYRASLEADPNQPQAHLNLGNALVKQESYVEALSAYNTALKHTPDNLDALNNKAMVLQSLGRMEEARTVLQRAVEIAPGAEQAWTNLGLVLRLLREPDAAREAYEKAIAINPNSHKALSNLAVLLRREGDLDQAEQICRDILGTAPDVIEVLNNLGDILQAQGRVEEAREAFERVLMLDPSHPEGHHNLAVLMLLVGDFENAWGHYEWRWLAKGFPSERRNFSQPMWAGEELNGRTVLLYVEQGLGDAMQFVRYAPLVKAKGGHVVVECPQTLVRLFETVDGIDQVVAREDELPDFDLHCPFLSLPGVLSPSLETIPADVPYLQAPQDLRETWRAKLSELDGLKVGLVWAGRPLHTNDKERSMHLETLAPLFEVEGCSFVSLQIGDSATQIAECGFALNDWTDEIEDYTDTAALVSELDLVITVDTSVAHVTGALGKPVWVLVAHAPDWRWMLEREDTPWYPTMRLFRQPVRRDWNSVLERVTGELKALATNSGT